MADPIYISPSAKLEPKYTPWWTTGVNSLLNQIYQKVVGEPFNKTFNENDQEAIGNALGLVGIGGPGTTSSQAMMPKIGARNPLYKELFKKKFGFDPEGEKVVRYQQENVPYPVSQGSRGAVFFSKEGWGGGYQQSKGSVEGGDVKVTHDFAPSTPLLLFRDHAFVGPHVLDKFKVKLPYGANSVPYSQLDKNVQRLVTEKEWNLARQSRSGLTALQELLASKVLRERGYDSIISLRPKKESITDDPVTDKKYELMDKLAVLLDKSKLGEFPTPQFGNKAPLHPYDYPEKYNNFVDKSDYLITNYNKYSLPVRLLDKLDRARKAGKLSPNANMENIVNKIDIAAWSSPASIDLYRASSGVYDLALEKLAKKLAGNVGKSYYPSQLIDISPEVTDKNLNRYYRETGVVDPRLGRPRAKPDPNVTYSNPSDTPVTMGVDPETGNKYLTVNLGGKEYKMVVTGGYNGKGVANILNEHYNKGELGQLHLTAFGFKEVGTPKVTKSTPKPKETQQPLDYVYPVDKAVADKQMYEGVNFEVKPVPEDWFILTPPNKEGLNLTNDSKYLPPGFKWTKWGKEINIPHIWESTLSEGKLGKKQLGTQNTIFDYMLWNGFIGKDK